MFFEAPTEKPANFDNSATSKPLMPGSKIITKSNVFIEHLFNIDSNLSFLELSIAGSNSNFLSTLFNTAQLSAASSKFKLSHAIVQKIALAAPALKNKEYKFLSVCSIAASSINKSSLENRVATPTFSIAFLQKLWNTLFFLM
eukprot:TRINITY_DN556_c0_g2_i1.p78 TRINITY_DN556_c0_g2~~TRINITY_DN556_c0_g2_i1.p78  ORF type:complete len:143 (+),score=1.61 TRINITY_DN556_c0_g2_i1:24435-24863(+)